MERTKIEQLFENLFFLETSFGGGKEDAYRNRFDGVPTKEGQMVTDTGRDRLGIFWYVMVSCVPIWYRKPEKKLLYAGYIRENSV